MLVTLINSVKTEGPRWILVLPLLHLLKGFSKPFTPISITVTPKYEQSWAGLQGLKAGNMALNSQDRRYSTSSILPVVIENHYCLTFWRNSLF